MTNAAPYQSELAIALGDDMNRPAIWYEPFRPLPQKRYVGQDSTFNSDDKVHISFLDENEQPTLLGQMLPESFDRPDWRVPCTADESVGQKAHLRVRMTNIKDEDAVLCEVNHPINIRGFQSTPQLITKLKLGRRIAKALNESTEFMAFCKARNYAFEDLALGHLEKVSQGSWQPTLFIVKAP